MNLVPYESYYLTTTLPRIEIVKRLMENTAPKSPLFFDWKKRSNKLYEGFVTDRSFRITRRIAYRNSFLPIISGKIIAYNSSIRVYIKMRMYLAVYIFMIFWLGFVATAGVAVIKAMIKEQQFHPSIFGVGIMFAAGYGLTMWGFKSESSKAKKFLVELLCEEFNER